jgi:hypothetical protein
MSRMLAGFTMYGTDVYVRPEDLEAARELLSPAEAEQEAADEQSEADA